MTRRPDCRFVRRGLGVLVAALLLGPGPAGAADIVPHAATYDLVLQSLRLEGKAAASDGKLLLRIEQICEGWRVATRLDFGVTLETGQALRIETSNGVEESAKGDLLSFATVSRLNGEVQWQTKGAASVASGDGGRAVFTEPSRQDLPLPPGTTFPAAGARLLLDRLVAGRTQVTRKIFDGSAPEPFGVIDTVARGRLAPGGPPRGDGALLSARSWRLQSLWTRDDGRETIQKMELQLHANGVASRMVLDLGVLVVDARLKEIERLPVPECPAPGR